MPTIPSTRSLWRPKLKECAEQCASCPFREGNDDEFRKAVEGFFPGVLLDDNAVAIARERIRGDLKFSGDFICHCTIYKAKGKLREVQERRQCPGATKYYRESPDNRSTICQPKLKRF